MVELVTRGEINPRGGVSEPGREYGERQLRAMEWLNQDSTRTIGRAAVLFNVKPHDLRESMHHASG